ncbi:MAG: hypothetical protein K0Q93_2155 [Nocardioidaceae bacterium]|nr:hypothetical protein [Nocardioidaceae bacterium]
MLLALVLVLVAVLAALLGWGVAQLALGVWLARHPLTAEFMRAEIAHDRRAKAKPKGVKGIKIPDDLPKAPAGPAMGVRTRPADQYTIGDDQLWKRREYLNGGHLMWPPRIDLS